MKDSITNKGRVENYVRNDSRFLKIRLSFYLPSNNWC